MRNGKKTWYSGFAKAASHFCGRPKTFALAVAVIIAWVISGPIFGFSDTWQLVINTGTTIVTFLMVFLIQNTQNRDTEAMQIKLDELIRATKERTTRCSISKNSKKRSWTFFAASTKAWRRARGMTSCRVARTPAPHSRKSANICRR